MDSELKKNITGIRNQIVDYTLIFSTILGVLVYGLSLYKLLDGEFKISHITDLIILCSIAFITVYRFRISIQVKAFVILAGIFMLIFIDLIQLGLLSANKLLLVIIPFFSLTVFSLRQTIVIFSVTVAGFILVAAFTISGHNIFLLETEKQIVTLMPWLINISILIIISLIIMYVSHRFNKTYERVFFELESQNELIAERERNYREIFNTSSDAILILDVQGKIVDVNNAAVTIFNRNFSELVSYDFSSLWSHTGLNPGIDLDILVKSNKEFSEKFLEIQIKKNGGICWLDLMLKTSIIGGIRRIMVVARDITEKKLASLQIEEYKNNLEEQVKARTMDLHQVNEELVSANDSLIVQKEKLSITLDELRKTQQQLIHNEKMASIGILTAGVAHEINNPLNFIQSGVFSMEELWKSSNNLDDFYNYREDMKKILELITVGVTRVGNIVSGLNHFNRQTSSFNEKCNIHNIIENCLLVLQNNIKGRISIIRQFTTSQVVLIGNSGKLHQAFLNIILNATQAIPKEGTITIKTQLEKDSAIIEIRDTGIGISEELLTRIFDPFYTTKPVGQGTGLGLSITYGIITEHGGQISYTSVINEGSTATVILPL
jgi:PAS domain S-box-containing protein